MQVPYYFGKEGMGMENRDLMRLLMRASSSARCKPWRAEEDFNRKPSGMGHILDLLQRENGLTQQEIAARLEIRPQSVSEAIARLEKRGLVRKEPDEHDRRAMRVLITPEGVVRRRELAVLRAAHADAFFGVLTEEEKESLAKILRKLENAAKNEQEGTT